MTHEQTTADYGIAPPAYRLPGGTRLGRVSLQVNEGFIDREPTIESYAAAADDIMTGTTTEVTPISSRSFARMFEGYSG